jgi:predicted RNA-binding protein associated with RNAse of E/G family
MPQTIRYRYRRPGRDVMTYEQLLVLDRPDVKVLLQESYGGDTLRAGDQVIQEAGAPIVWYVFPEKWHDIGRFHLADGAFTGWYTNLTTPVAMNGDTWSATDMFLDLWQPAEGEPVWLDEDEFEEAVRRKVIDTATKKRVLNERAIIELQVRQGEWPPPIARDIDLAQGRALADTAA